MCTLSRSSSSLAAAPRVACTRPHSAKASVFGRTAAEVRKCNTKNNNSMNNTNNMMNNNMNNTNNMNNKHEQQHQNEQGKAVCSRLPPRLQGNRPRVALQRRQPEGELPQLFRAGWISMLLLECLWKQCNHPAQGLACFSASSMCRIPAAENKCRVRTVSGALRRRLGKTRAGSVRTDDEFSDRQAARRP